VRKYDEATDDEDERAARVAIAAGGTAGHVAPALAVAQRLRERGTAVSFIGGARAEAEMVPAAGFELHRLDLEGLSRTNPAHAARAALRAGAASVRARSLLRALGARAVLGAGGYASGPVGLAALSLRLPLVLTEADSRLGLANRLLAPGARRVCLAFPIAGREGSRYRVTGRPVPFLGGNHMQARARFGVPAERTCIVVFGGSLGARSINEAALHGLGGGDWHVLHIAGRRDYRALADELTRGGRRTGYDLREYLSLEELAWALSAADLVVARAGGSVLEIAAHGVPAILVPYPGAAGEHQLHNARFVEAAGAAVVVPDAELGPERLRAEVGSLLGDAERMAALAASARALARPRAADEVADELLEALAR
jgi:UDP-N-acetylglucosamine--N-acetylmuramyl-(pentapeptide) pyrophosphoryl-undecaprenol N-acetylglucosamine transferase